MKSRYARIGLVLMTTGMVLFGYGCGQQGDTATGERASRGAAAAATPLAGFVAIERHYAEATASKQEEFQHAQNELRDRALMTKLSEEHVNLTREWQEKLKEYVDRNPLPWQVAFTALPDRPYTFTSVAVTGASHRGLTVSADITIDEDMTDSALIPRRPTGRAGLTLCFEVLDGRGEQVEGTRKCAVADGNRLRSEWVAGSTSSTSFAFGTREIIQMGDFGGIVETTRE